MQHHKLSIEKDINPKQAHDDYYQLRLEINTANIPNLQRKLAYLYDKEVNAITPHNALSPLHLVCLAKTNEHTKIEMAKLLLDYGFDVNAQAIDPRIKERSKNKSALITPLDLVFCDPSLINLKKLIIKHNGVSLYQHFHNNNNFMGNPGYLFVKPENQATPKLLQEFILKNHLDHDLTLLSSQYKSDFRAIDHAKTHDKVTNALLEFINEHTDEHSLKEILSEPILQATNVPTILDIVKGRRRLYLDTSQMITNKDIRLKDILTVKSILLLAGAVDLVEKYFSNYPLWRENAILWFAENNSNLPDILLYAIYLKQAGAVEYILNEECNLRHDQEDLLACALEMFDYHTLGLLIDHCIAQDFEPDFNKQCLSYYKDHHEVYKLEYLTAFFNLKKDNYSFLKNPEQAETALRTLDKNKALFILKMSKVDLSQKDDNDNNYLHSLAMNVTDDTQHIFQKILSFITMRIHHPKLYLENQERNNCTNLLNEVNKDKKNVVQLLCENEKLSHTVKQTLLFTLMNYNAIFPPNIYEKFILTNYDFYSIHQQHQDKLAGQIRLIIENNKKMKINTQNIQTSLKNTIDYFQSFELLSERKPSSPMFFNNSIKLEKEIPPPVKNTMKK